MSPRARPTLQDVMDALDALAADVLAMREAMHRMGPQPMPAQGVVQRYYGAPGQVQPGTPAPRQPGLYVEPQQPQQQPSPTTEDVSHGKGHREAAAARPRRRTRR
jgi:hypothetical protein